MLGASEKVAYNFKTLKQQNKKVNIEIFHFQAEAAKIKSWTF